MAHGSGAVNRVYKKRGFAGVWQWCRFRGIKPWIRARAWARKKAAQAKDPKGFRKAQRVYGRRIAYLKRHRDPKPKPIVGNLVSFDGKTVPGWIANILSQARASGRWSGTVISGYRSPAYSESLCIAMCGAPTCPGRCAGRYSNHACPPDGKGTPYEGAVDVTDQFSLEAYCRSVGAPLYGGGYALPLDTPHFSNSGR